MPTNVIMGANIKRESVRINPNGDIINPKNKQVIQANTQEDLSQPTVEAIKAPATNENVQSGALSILQQIEEAKANLKALEELKKLKIKEKKAELEALQQ